MKYRLSYIIGGILGAALGLGLIYWIAGYILDWLITCVQTSMLIC